MDLTKSNSHFQKLFVSKHQHLPQEFRISFLLLTAGIHKPLQVFQPLV